MPQNTVPLTRHIVEGIEEGQAGDREPPLAPFAAPLTCCAICCASSLPRLIIPWSCVRITPGLVQSSNFLGALNMPGLIGTVPTPRATARSAFQVMGGRENDQAIFQIRVWLLRDGFLGRLWFLWWHGDRSS